jgi:flagella basal body P-ring formation protein FlgA
MPIVKRDAIVQISYSVPGMEITTSGQALAPGARGDVIEVRNTTSKKVVRAVIEASDRVQVIVPNTQTSQLTPAAGVTGIKTVGDTRATY